MDSRVHFSETRFCHVPLLSSMYRHSVCTDSKCCRTVRNVVALFDDCRIWSARSRVVTTAFRLKLPDNGRCGFGLTAGSFVPMLMQTRFHSFSPDPCHRVVYPTPVFAHVRARQSRNFISNNWTRARQVYGLLAAVLTPLHYDCQVRSELFMHTCFTRHELSLSWSARRQENKT